jgi:hypothetical protein
MAERLHNPFAGVDVTVPQEFRERFQRYCQTGGGTRGSFDRAPFPRMVDLWFLALCFAAREGLGVVESQGSEYKVIEGSIFNSDPGRIHALMLVAIAIQKDINIVSEPRRMMAIANGLARAGLPRVFELLDEDSGADAIWGISDGIAKILSAA